MPLRNQSLKLSLDKQLIGTETFRRNNDCLDFLGQNGALPTVLYLIYSFCCKAHDQATRLVTKLTIRLFIRLFTFQKIIAYFHTFLRHSSSLAFFLPTAKIARLLFA